MTGIQRDGFRNRVDGVGASRDRWESSGQLENFPGHELSPWPAILAAANAATVDLVVKPINYRDAKPGDVLLIFI